MLFIEFVLSIMTRKECALLLDLLHPQLTRNENIPNGGAVAINTNDVGQRSDASFIGRGQFRMQSLKQGITKTKDGIL